jgi:2-polyprenyl-3-methyl-5-hydroxy-6-metoxy-1,4-benzoquinol methylase
VSSMNTETHQDLIGEQTLSVIQRANLFNEWMYNTINPYLKDNILEIGSGIGNISEFVVRDFTNITLSDYNEGYVRLLRERWSEKENVRAFLSIDLQASNFETQYSFLQNKFDCIFLLNVIEHLENDKYAVKNCQFMLRKGGHLVVLAPSYQYLYCTFDKYLGHFRRYTVSSLRSVMSIRGNTILHTQYFNSLGILGWFVSGKLLGQSQIGKKEMSTFNKLVPIARLADKVFINSIGLSSIVVAKKD